MEGHGIVAGGQERGQTIVPVLFFKLPLCTNNLTNTQSQFIDADFILPTRKKTNIKHDIELFLHLTYTAAANLVLLSLANNEKGAVGLLTAGAVRLPQVNGAFYRFSKPALARG